jgi:hypothetical protein
MNRNPRAVSAGDASSFSLEELDREASCVSSGSSRLIDFTASALVPDVVAEVDAVLAALTPSVARS